MRPPPISITKSKMPGCRGKAPASAVESNSCTNDGSGSARAGASSAGSPADGAANSASTASARRFGSPTTATLKGRFASRAISATETLLIVSQNPLTPPTLAMLFAPLGPPFHFMDACLHRRAERGARFRLFAGPSSLAATPARRRGRFKASVNGLPRLHAEQVVAQSLVDTDVPIVGDGGLLPLVIEDLDLGGEPDALRDFPRGFVEIGRVELACLAVLLALENDLGARVYPDRAMRGVQVLIPIADIEDRAHHAVHGMLAQKLRLGIGQVAPRDQAHVQQRLALARRVAQVRGRADAQTRYRHILPRAVDDQGRFRDAQAAVQAQLVLFLVEQVRIAFELVGIPEVPTDLAAGVIVIADHVDRGVEVVEAIGDIVGDVGTDLLDRRSGGPVARRQAGQARARHP